MSRSSSGLSRLIPDMNAEVVVYCANYGCPASIEAGKTLKRLGYTNVHDFKGGMKEWLDRKYTVEGYKARAAANSSVCAGRLCGAPPIRPASSLLATGLICRPNRVNRRSTNPSPSRQGIPFYCSRRTMSPFEIIMLVCFGAAWPFSIVKAYRSRENGGKSLLFLIVIFIGYLAGTANKLSYKPDGVRLPLFLNGVMVAMDIAIHFRNRQFAAQPDRGFSGRIAPRTRFAERIREQLVADLLYVGIVIAFFALTIAGVKALDRI